METRYCVSVIFVLLLVSSRLEISVQNSYSAKDTSKEHNQMNFLVKKQLNVHSGLDMNKTLKSGIIQNTTYTIEGSMTNRSIYFSPLVSLNFEIMDELKLALVAEPRRAHSLKRSVDYKLYVGQNLSKSQAVLVRRVRSVETKITTPKENPHAALMSIFKTHDDLRKKVKEFCTGSMIASRWLISTAHCMSKKYIFHIYTGGNDYFEYEDKRYAKGSDYANGYFRDKLIVLPNYSENYLTHDLALLKIDSGSYGVRTDTIDLSIYLLPFNQYKSCSFTGFGRREKGPHDTYRRRTHYMNVKSPCPCVGGTEEKDNALLCSEPGGGYEVCDGDLGSGLVCDGELVAVVSKLISKSTCKEITIDQDHLCGSEDAIVVFVKVCPYLAWINEGGRIFKDYYGKMKECHEPTPKPTTDAVTDPFIDYDHATDYPDEDSTSKVRRPKKNKTRKHHHPKNNGPVTEAVGIVTLYLSLTYIYLAK